MFGLLLLWSQGNVETAVAVQHAGLAAIHLGILPGCDKHGDFGTILARVENLLHLEQVLVKARNRGFTDGLKQVTRVLE